MVIVTLAPRGALHVGEAIGIERQRVLSHVPSDTLFAALFTIWAQEGRGAEMLRRFLSSGPPPFTLTSAFLCLYAGADGRPQATLRFYPRPLVSIRADEQRREEVGKKLKAAWVSQNLFERLRRGDDVSDACRDDCFAPRSLWIDPADLPHLADRRDAQGHLHALWEADNVPRVTLDRATNASVLYHVGRLDFSANVGLWFGLRIQAVDIVSHLQRALDLLSDSGLGGLRSIGLGAFTWGWREEESADDGDSGYAVTLARYAPRDDEEVRRILQAPHTAYTLVTVGGWCVDDSGHPWRRMQTRMVPEGSLIGRADTFAGWMVPVAPRRPDGWDEALWPFVGRQVYRWGYAFPVGVARAALPVEVRHG
jgi:CRISPR type III-A-associated RAMP protein Csm4